MTNDWFTWGFHSIDVFFWCVCVRVFMTECDSIMRENPSSWAAASSHPRCCPGTMPMGSRTALGMLNPSAWTIRTQPVP